MVRKQLLAAVVIMMIFVVYLIVVGQPEKPQKHIAPTDETFVDTIETKETVKPTNVEKYPDVFAVDLESMMNLEGMKKNAPAFSFTDEYGFEASNEENFHNKSSNGIDQYMNEQLMSEPGKKFRISTGYNQLGAVKPVNSLGEQIKLGSISTVF